MAVQRNQRGVPVRQTLTYLVLLLGAFVSLFPFYWLVAGSLKAPRELLRMPPSLLPGELTLNAYRFVWETMDVPRAFTNSTIVSVSEVGLNVCFSALVAYALAKMRVPGKRYLMWLVLALMMIPFQIMMIPLFLQIHRLGLLDSYAGIILPGAVSSFTIFLLHQAFTTIPNDYVDAALVDGASHFGIMTRIAVPMIFPMILTAILINFLWSWNGFLWPFIVIQSDDMATLPVALARYQGFQAQRWDAVLAGATITSVPIVILYLIFQRKFIESLAMTGLKG
jgi:multiple sugar transport system permease protein